MMWWAGTVAGKITDLPGVSIGIVPLLARAGVKALHIGTNGQGTQVFPSFPGGGNLPQVFRWRHPTTGDEVVVMNEEHYGRMIVPDKTLGLTDVLRWQFTVRFADRLQTTYLAWAALLGARPLANDLSRWVASSR